MNGSTDPTQQAQQASQANPPNQNQQVLNNLERLRAQSLALTGGRTANAAPLRDQVAQLSQMGSIGVNPLPVTGGVLPLQGRAKDFRNEAEIRAKTNAKRPIDYVPKKTPARDAAGPPINMNLTQLTSDASGKVNTSEWMHDWWGHSCGCSEDT